MDREEEEQSKHGAWTTTQDWTVLLFLAKADRQVKTAHLLPAKPCRLFVDLLKDEVRVMPNDTDNSEDGDSDIAVG